jgi:hypothetical protein
MAVASADDALGPGTSEAILTCSVLPCFVLFCFVFTLVDISAERSLRIT